MVKKKIRSLSLSRALTGLLLGLIGFCIPLIIHFDGLSLAGHLAMGIFFMAAVFWMFEPIPIYSTSMLVIFLQVLLLSSQGPLYSKGELPEVMPVAVEEGVWALPRTALDQDRIFIKTGARSYEPLTVEILEHGSAMLVRAAELRSDLPVVRQARHKLIGYSPVSYTLFFGTLANPIIILFLGGFMLAAGAVKYNLDKNLTNVLLKPFGRKPIFIVLGLMLVTATLSAFMSNTATTAMMMTVAIPIAMQVSKQDKFRIMLALSIPIAANIGGMATPIGTPPNAIVISALNSQGLGIEFGTWMALMVPLAILLLLAAWATMRMLFKPSLQSFKLELQSTFNRSQKAWVLYVIFGLTVLLWITESSHGIPSGMVAFLPIAGLTVTSVLGKEDIRGLPWEVLWLVAGGIALGISMENTGMAIWMVSSIDWAMFPKILLLLVFGLVAWMLSNFLSNTVTATLIIPLAVSLAVSGIAGEGFNLVIAALVIGSACNIAMLLPISTPPNAIAMSTGFIKTSDMIKVGLVVGVIGLVAALLLSVVFWPLLIN
jgi:sodium-dependent dicarboxylate transporter 2/3/5